MAIITKTVGSGKDYTTLNAALAGEQKDITASGSNQSYVFECDAIQDTTKVVVSATWVTDSTHTITIQTSTANRHTGVRGTGYRLVTNTDWDYAFYSTVAWVILDGISMRNSSALSYCLRFNCSSPDTKKVWIKNCLFADSVKTANIAMTVNSVIVNTVSLNGAYTTGAGFKSYNGVNPTTHYLYNVTCLNNVGATGYGFYFCDYGIFYVKNCYSGASTTYDYYKQTNANVTFTTCASSDGSLSTSVVSVTNAAFTVSTAGSENINTLVESKLRKIGTDLSSDAVYPFNYDYLSNTRPTGLLQWDIGAFQNFISLSTFKPIVIIV